MKKLFFLLSILSINYLSAQKYIDAEQVRIDLIDGVKDNFIDHKSPNVKKISTSCFIVLVDSIQEELQKESFSNFANGINIELYKELYKINATTLIKTKNFKPRYAFLLSFLQAQSSGNGLSFLNKNVDKVFSVLSFISFFKETESFLNKLPNNYIDQILYHYKDFKNTTYAQALLEELILKAPLTSKKYFIPSNAIFKAMQASTSKEIKVLVDISNKYKRNSKSYVLLDKIMSSEMNIEQADATARSPYYLQSLLELRSQKKPLAYVSLDREIQYEVLEYVREINHLHDNTNPNIRFACIKNLNALTLYSLIVYTEDEIFTSSFNGLYKKLVNQMQIEALSGYTLLEKAGFNKFRVLLKMLSYYGELNSFLDTMEASEKEYVLRTFVGGIPLVENRIPEAVSVVDAISAIEDKEILAIIEEELYAINKLENLDKESKLLYGLLINMFNPKVQVYHAFFDSVSALYNPPPIDKIDKQSLLGNDSINVQKHFFYDDDDGEASYHSFIGTFRSNNWKVIVEEEYIKIVSKNNKVKIYANKPKFEETAWYLIDKEIEKNNEDVEFIIHRGHSYYVEATINSIPTSSKLILLGSCGGYNKLSDILKKSNNAHIISTKQIGSMGVNNPLIFGMAEKVRKGQDLVWKKYWDELKIVFKNRGKTTTRFYDYVLPHKNLGAKFITTYQMYNN